MKAALLGGTALSKGGVSETLECGTKETTGFNRGIDSLCSRAFPGRMAIEAILVMRADP